MGPPGEQDIQSKGLSLLFLLGRGCECLHQDLNSLVLTEQQQMVQDEEGHPRSSLCNPLISTLTSSSPQPSLALLPSFFSFFFPNYFVAWCLSCCFIFPFLFLGGFPCDKQRESQLAAPATRGHMSCSQGIRNHATICQLFGLSWVVQWMNGSN